MIVWPLSWWWWSTQRENGFPSQKTKAALSKLRCSHTLLKLLMIFSLCLDTYNKVCHYVIILNKLISSFMHVMLIIFLEGTKVIMMIKWLRYLWLFCDSFCHLCNFLKGLLSQDIFQLWIWSTSMFLFWLDLEGKHMESILHLCLVGKYKLKKNAKILFSIKCIFLCFPYFKFRFHFRSITSRYFHE